MRIGELVKLLQMLPQDEEIAIRDGITADWRSPFEPAVGMDKGALYYTLFADDTEPLGTDTARKKATGVLT